MNWISLPARDWEGRTTSVELGLGPDSVECWWENRRVAVFDRATLRVWLTVPYGFYSAGDIMWRMSEGNLWLSVDASLPWAEVSVANLALLRECL